MPADPPEILVAGSACRYPDAAGPAELLENSLAGRRAFRPIPPERLPLADYAAERVGEADSITRVPAGLLTDWRFDAGRFRIPKSAYASADLTHWLALEVAAEAVEAAGGLDGLDRSRIAVVVANTLTGEFSRAALLRLRWPWIDGLLADAASAAGLDPETAAALRRRMGGALRSAFPDPDEESLAGGLANTIAGRIANVLDLGGGAWSVDGACASSLVAVANAAELIAAGRADAAIVAAVDLSLDPFELVGFSRNGALAKGRMRVFDRRSEGFWPGEGAGAVVLMSRAAAARRGLPRLLTLAGWGISTDGKGGLTRPTAEGQRRAIERAWALARLDPGEVDYVEAHGTGTAVGDPTEIRALAEAVGGARVRPLPIGSVKANIGHTKAAAGLAGLIRTAEAMKAGVIPPQSGCDEPHPAFAETGERVRVPLAPEAWPAAGRRTAGVSSFGFGGVNSHVVLACGERRRAAVPSPAPLRESEIFLFRGASVEALSRAVERLAGRAETLSLAELGDAAADAAARLQPGPFSLAFVASCWDPLQERLAEAAAVLDGAAPRRVRFGRTERPPRIALAFPGQAAPVRPNPGAWARRFPGRHAAPTLSGDPQRTDNAQPAIAAACLAGLDLLDRLHVEAKAAIGHSLGELAALAWAGALDPADLVALAAARGRAMAALPAGAMIRLACPGAEAEALSAGLGLAVACFNGPAETILSGPFEAVAAAERRAAAARIETQRLAVSHAFHAPAMGAAEAPLREALAGLDVAAPVRPVASTIAGGWLTGEEDVRTLLVRQLTEPVLFTQAAEAMSDVVDVVIEVGPGAGLGRLLAPFVANVASLDVFGDDVEPALEAVAMIFGLGAEIDPRALFDGPGLRRFSEAPPALLASPCGRGQGAAPLAVMPAAAEAPPAAPVVAGDGDVLASLRALVAAETGLEVAAVDAEHRFLDDLHLNSLAVSRLMARLGEAVGRRPPGFATLFANARLREAAEAFEEAELFAADRGRARVAGVARWVRRFEPARADLPWAPEQNLRWEEVPLSGALPAGGEGLLIDLKGEWDARRDAGALVRTVQQAVGRFEHLALRHADAPLAGFGRSLVAEELFRSVRLLRGGTGGLRRGIAGFEEIVEGSDGSLAGVALAPAREEDSEAGEAPHVVLVTGGARGIGAECAVRLAERCGCALILAGRAAADASDVRRTLERAAAVGAAVRYVQADVTDGAALEAGVRAAAAELGRVTHLVHAAGINEPVPLVRLDEALLERTLAPKTAGLEAAVAACGPALRRAVAFGSIIGRMGLAGEAHYALANAEQSRLLARIAAERGLSALAIEWSVWAGAGMGERLGAVERLAAGGVDAIDLDQALDAFEALALGGRTGAVVVTSRFGNDAALAAPPLRFVETALVHTPGVELVLETSLGAGRDRYLEDHRVDGAAVMPGVMILEAFAQAASALTGRTVLSLRDVAFVAAVEPGEGDLSLRIGVLREGAATHVELRTAADGFSGVCASAVLLAPEEERPEPLATGPGTADAAPLYGPLFFHGPAFAKVERLVSASSRHVAARLGKGRTEGWFGPFEAPTLLLGDPGLRDAALHVLQCCVPHRRLVPVSTAAIDIFPGGIPDRIEAREIWTRGGDYAFDILIGDETGAVVERWREAVFRAVGEIDPAAALAACPALVPAWLERRAREATGDESLRLCLVDDPAASREARRARAALALGFAAPPLRRGDGAPAPAPDGRRVSFSHTGSVTLAVSAAGRPGCDIERVSAFATGELAELWSAEEALRKLGSGASLKAAGAGLFTGDEGERIVAVAAVPTEAGMVSVAVGVGGRP